MLLKLNPGYRAFVVPATDKDDVNKDSDIVVIYYDRDYEIYKIEQAPHEQQNLLG